MSTISDRLNDLKERKGLSYRKIGEAMDRGESQVRRWFTGENVPGGENLLRLAEVFGVSVSDITGAPGEHDCWANLGLEGVAPIGEEELLVLQLYRILDGKGVGGKVVDVLEALVATLAGTKA